jgi:hypothetical protein
MPHAEERFLCGRTQQGLSGRNDRRLVRRKSDGFASMPAFPVLNDRKLADVATFLRNA